MIPFPKRRSSRRLSRSPSAFQLYPESAFCFPSKAACSSSARGCPQSPCHWVSGASPASAGTRNPPAELQGCFGRAAWRLATFFQAGRPRVSGQRRKLLSELEDGAGVGSRADLRAPRTWRENGSLALLQSERCLCSAASRARAALSDLFIEAF